MSVTTNTYTETDLGNISPNPRGEYNAKLAYEYLDLVEFKGGSYLCVIELGETVTDVAPTEGETTAVWQCIAVPGGLTPEYINIHTEVLAKSKEVETNRQAVSEMKTSLEQLEVNVTTKHDETVASATAAKISETNAKTSETEAKKSEQSALDSKNSMDQTIVDFNAGLDTVKSNIVGELNTVKDDAISAINTQTDVSIKDVKAQTADYINKEKLIAQQELHDTVDNFNTTVAGKKDEIVNVATEKIQQMTTLLSDTTDAKNAAQTSEVNAKKSETASKQSETNAKASETNVVKLEKDVATAKDEILSVKTQIDADKTAIDKAVTDTQTSATKAKESETKAKESETASAQSATEALASKNEASASATTATEKATLASTKADEASASATNAKASETKSKEAETNVTTMQTQVTKDKEAITTIKTEVTALQESINASGDKINTDATTAIKNIETKKTEVVDAIEQYGAIQVSTEVPTSPHVDVHINPTNEENYFIPEVRDDLMNDVDTWSSKKINNEVKSKADAIVDSASGEAIALTDSAEAPLRGLRIFGKSTQDGTPSPESPVPIVNVGDKGNIALKIDGDIPPQSLTLATPNGLPGIKVDSDGNYTDENGQQWICDEIDLERGKYVQRMWRHTLTKNLVWSTYITPGAEGFLVQVLPEQMKNRKILCSHFEMYNNGTGKLKEGVMAGAGNNVLYFPMNRFFDNALPDKGLANWKAFLAENPMEVITYLNTPIERDLTPEEIAAYKALHTNYPTTVISNDESAHMKVSYVADTKNYIAKVNASLQKQITDLQNALISQKISGGGIKVTDSARVPVIKFSMWGKTEQMQTTGAQLFDISKISAVNVAVDKDVIIVKDYASNTRITAEQFMEMTGLKPGDSFTISYTFEGTITGSTGGAIFLGSSKSLNIVNGGQTGSLKNTVTLPSNFGSEYGQLYFYGNNKGENCYIKNFMINKGNIAKPYELYTDKKPSPSPEYPQSIEVTDHPITVTIKGGTEQQSITLVPPKPLTKWDKLEKIDSVWQWVYQSDNAIYDGSENWIGYSEENRKGVFELRVNSAKRKESADIFCSRYKGVYEPIDRLQDNEITLYYSRLDNNPNDNWIDLKDTAYSDVSEFKNSLFENPLTVYYETTTPEYIPLPQSEQDKLNSLTMYAPTTEITNDGGCNMELTYTVNTKSYIDTKIAEISKAIL